MNTIKTPIKKSTWTVKKYNSKAVIISACVVVIILIFGINFISNKYYEANMPELEMTVANNWEISIDGEVLEFAPDGSATIWWKKFKIDPKSYDVFLDGKKVIITWSDWATFKDYKLEIMTNVPDRDGQIIGWTEEVTVDSIMQDDGKTLINYYKKFSEESGMNIYETISDSFKKLDSLEEFLIFKKNFLSDPFFITLLREEDKKWWNKFWELTYEQKASNKNGVFVKMFTKILWEEFNEKDFSAYMAQTYDDLLKGKNSISDEDMQLDLNVYFNTLDLAQALEKCDELIKTNPYYFYPDTCKGKIYFYRATTQNWYCDKISEDYKKAICNDYINFDK